MKKLSEIKLNVNEIFYSIQGEGTRVGRPGIFIRLQGCLLRCVWCDTPYSLDRRVKANIMSGTQILDEINKFDNKYITLSGGEPLEQEDSFDLISNLCDLDFEVTIETNGQVDTKDLDKRAVRIMDMKCPDSKMSKKNNYENMNYLTSNDELKFVVSSKKDFDWAIELSDKYDIYNKVKAVLFSPVFGKVEPIELADWLKNTKRDNIRMQLQIHKYIWDPNLRGV